MTIKRGQNSRQCWVRDIQNSFLSEGHFSLLCIPQLYASDDLDNEVDEILQEFEHKVSRTVLHTVQFY